MDIYWSGKYHTVSYETQQELLRRGLILELVDPMGHYLSLQNQEAFELLKLLETQHSATTH